MPKSKSTSRLSAARKVTPPTNNNVNMKRKSTKVARSCAKCFARKVKCSQDVPCTSCLRYAVTRGEDPALVVCVYKTQDDDVLLPEVTQSRVQERPVVVVSESNGSDHLPQESNARNEAASTLFRSEEVNDKRGTHGVDLWSKHSPQTDTIPLIALRSHPHRYENDSLPTPVASPYIDFSPPNCLSNSIQFNTPPLDDGSPSPPSPVAPSPRLAKPPPLSLSFHSFQIHYPTLLNPISSAVDLDSNEFCTQPYNLVTPLDQFNYPAAFDLQQNKLAQAPTSHLRDRELDDSYYSYIHTPDLMSGRY